MDYRINKLQQFIINKSEGKTEKFLNNLKNLSPKEVKNIVNLFIFYLLLIYCYLV
jgi:hypothetical protein